MTTQSQNAQILRWLQRGRKLTALKAYKQFGCLRLSGRIFDLRKAKHPIESRMVKVGEKHVSEYFMKVGNKAA